MLKSHVTGYSDEDEINEIMEDYKQKIDNGDIVFYFMTFRGHKHIEDDYRYDVIEDVEVILTENMHSDSYFENYYLFEFSEFEENNHYLFYVESNDRFFDKIYLIGKDSNCSAKYKNSLLNIKNVDYNGFFIYIDTTIDSKTVDIKFDIDSDECEKFNKKILKKKIISYDDIFN